MEAQMKLEDAINLSEKYNQDASKIILKSIEIEIFLMREYSHIGYKENSQGKLEETLQPMFSKKWYDDETLRRIKILSKIKDYFK